MIGAGRGPFVDSEFRRLRAGWVECQPLATRRRAVAMQNYGSPGAQAAPMRTLKVSRAVLAVMPHSRTLRFTILESHLALRTDALRLGGARLAGQFDVFDGAIDAQMAGDGIIPHDANGGSVFHWLR
jgi:hypothetical protein